MPSLIDLRRRIRSVKNTQQITKAMKMVAASKLRRAQDRILATRPYALELRKILGHMAGQSEDFHHPLLESRAEENVLVAIVTGDKGLCGSFNSNVIRRSEELLRVHGSAELLLMGRRGADYFRRRSWSIRAALTTLFSDVTYGKATEISEDLIETFVDGRYDAVYVVYNEFVSVLTQRLTVERLLPLGGLEAQEPAPAGPRAKYLLEPSAAQVVDDLLPRFVAFQIYRILLESQAAEHGARMTAMDSATKNASELIDKLTLNYNRSRQAAITTELIEVVSGAKSLEG